MWTLFCTVAPAAVSTGHQHWSCAHPLQILSWEEVLWTLPACPSPPALCRGRLCIAPCSVSTNLPSSLSTIYSMSGIRHTYVCIILFNPHDKWKGSYYCPHLKDQGMQGQRGIEMQLCSRSWPRGEQRFPGFGLWSPFSLNITLSCSVSSARALLYAPVLTCCGHQGRARWPHLLANIQPQMSLLKISDTDKPYWLTSLKP